MKWLSVTLEISYVSGEKVPHDLNDDSRAYQMSIACRKLLG
jgi:hypothetical protein